MSDANWFLATCMKCGGVLQHRLRCPTLADSPLPKPAGRGDRTSTAEEAVGALREHAKLGCSPALAKLADELEKELRVDPLHPTGRCSCAGEGICLWCRTTDAARRWQEAQVLLDKDALASWLTGFAGCTVEKVAEELRLRLGVDDEGPKPKPGRTRVYREDPPMPLPVAERPEPSAPTPPEEPEPEVEAAA